MEDISFDIIYDASDGIVVTVFIATSGIEITLMGEISESGGTLAVTGAHIQAAGGQLTKAVMSKIATHIVREMDYDDIVIEGAARTTGARPGHRPRPIRLP